MGMECGIHIDDWLPLSCWGDRENYLEYYIQTLRNWVKAEAVVGVVLGYGLVQQVWLNFAIHAFAWLPYHFIHL